MAETTAPKYYNGSDLLIKVGGSQFGLCTSHTTTYGSETKERQVKAVDSEASTNALFSDKGVSKLSVSISAEGLRGSGDTFEAIRTAWFNHVPVDVVGYSRNGAEYLTGKFIITNLEEVTPAQDDATYSVSLENSGKVTIASCGDPEKAATSGTSSNS